MVELSESVWVGADPGGNKAFGLAFLSRSGEVTTDCVSSAFEAIDLITSPPLGVGVDAPLWWSSGKSSDRKADKWLRRTHGIASGTVQTANSLKGAALVQGAMFVSRLREKFPGVPVTEAHPKAFAKAFGGWESPTMKALGLVTSSGEHERDAVMAAIAAREGFERRWTIDLSLDRDEREQDPKVYWLGPISYFWPEKADLPTG